MTERTFDYVPRLDERNRAYRVERSQVPVLLEHTSRYWTPGYPVLDQGAEGACVGFGCTGEAMASPVRVKFPESPADAVARAIYKRAQKLDEWEGEFYEGTSVRAGMLVGREHGWWQGFRWAFNMLELRAALEEGPVVIGVEWRESQYYADYGDVDVRGDLAGWHCLLITGYTPRRRSFANTPAYRWRNSWGPEYGVNGSAWIRASDLDRILFQAGGEAAVPVGRAA